MEQALELLGRRLVAREVRLEEVVVEFDHVLDEMFVFDTLGLDEVLGDLHLLHMAGVVHERVVRQQVGDAVEARLLADGQLGRVGVRAERRSHL